MQVLGLYFKIVKTQKKTILLYSGIFLAVFTLFATFKNTDATSGMYQTVKANIAVTDYDNSPLSESFLDYLSTKATFYATGSSKEEMNEALYYGMVDYTIEIPKGFEASFLKGEEHLLQTQSRATNINANAMDLYIDSYLNAMYTYHATTSQSVKELHERVMQQLVDQLDIQMSVEETYTARFEFRDSYYNYFSYVIMALMISVIGTTMLSIFRNDVYKRNLISPLNNSNMNVQLLLANILLASTLWSVFFLVSLVYTSDIMFSYSGFLHMINSYLFTIVCASLSYLISCFLIDKAHAHDTLNGTGNIISLGSAFLCGAFVPQSMLSSSILAFSKFLPSYWYVRANNLMATGLDLRTFESKEVWVCLGIQVLFVLAFFMIALAIARNKRSQETFLAPGEQEA